MKSTTWGVVCLCLILNVRAQSVNHSGIVPPPDSFQKYMRSELVKARTLKATGMVFTMAGLASTAIGIDMELRQSKHSICSVKKSVFILNDLEMNTRKSGKTCIIGGAIAIIIGIPTWYAGAKKIQEIQFSTRNDRNAVLTISPPVPVQFQETNQVWVMTASLRF